MIGWEQLIILLEAVGDQVMVAVVALLETADWAAAAAVARRMVLVQPELVAQVITPVVMAQRQAMSPEDLVGKIPAVALEVTGGLQVAVQTVVLAS